VRGGALIAWVGGMPRTRRRRSTRSFSRAAELSLLAPQVIALRMLRTHDAVEMQRMAMEKVFAFWECAGAMSLQMLKASPWNRVLEEGMRPIHRRAAANARRLRRRSR
jgi:hypothetical protein